MSTEDTPSPVTRLVPILTIITIIIMIGAAVFHITTLGPKPAPTFSRGTAPAAPDYSERSAWFVRPDVELVGGWGKPWGVDLLWFADGQANYPGGWNAPIDWTGADASANLDKIWLDSVLIDQGVFAPRRRTASSFANSPEDTRSANALEQEDIFASFDQYADADHKLRGVFIGGRGTGINAAISVYENRIADTLPFKNLFGGIILAPGTEVDSISGMPDLQQCSAEPPTFPCLLNLGELNDEAAAEAVSETMRTFSIWLDENVPKPAEPLPPIQTISIVPINRPDEN